MSLQLPQEGVIFWPVSCGDSTTVVINKDTILQIDLNHLSRSEDEDDPASDVIDELEDLLPKSAGKPFLSTFVLTHPDLDHCRGFADLLKRVKIGELWFSPRIFREYKKDLSDDACAFKKEAERRVKKMIEAGGQAQSGDRVRIIGYDDLLKEDEFKGFPASKLTVPGNPVTEINGTDHSNSFRAFIHAPFKDGGDAERNESSIAMQVRFMRDGMEGNALFFGDLSYPTLKRIFDNTRDKSNLHWNMILTPHHCSKSAMFWRDNEDGDEVLKQDILDSFESTRLDPNFIVASCAKFPESDEPGANPPHLKAKEQYETITHDFHCTHEHIDEDMPHPIVFELTDEGLVYRRPKGNKKARLDRVAAATTKARGSSEPPKERVGFGKPQ
jgi:beta-lactamase superfamily II metal-dependent hydrolase